MSVYVSAELRRHVRAQFANCCAYCRTAEALTATSFEFEHIVPLSAGGTTTINNVCFSCPMCNRFKSDHVCAVDPVSEESVPLFHPQQNHWADHFSWNDDYSEVVGLTSRGRATVIALKMNRILMIRIRRMWVAMGEHPPNID